MKTRDLIAYLQTTNPDADVFTFDEEGDMVDVVVDALDGGGLLIWHRHLGLPNGKPICTCGETAVSRIVNPTCPVHEGN